MKFISVCCALLAMFFVMDLSTAAHAGGAPAYRGAYPPLDHTLMGFKEIGVWYFLCTAPTYMERIPPHYLTFGPPPVPYCPPPWPPQVPVRPMPHKVK